MTDFRRTGFTRFNAPLAAGTTGAEDPLFAAVRETAAPDYEVLGEITRSVHSGAVVFLARAAADRGLVALRVTPEADGQEFGLELVKRLDASLPAPGGTCSKCGAPFVAWARFCNKCGSAIFGSADPQESPHARAELRVAVEEAAAGRYEVLGEMRHAEGAGVVYFARSLATGKIEALRVQPEGEQEFSVGKTNVMRRLSVSIQATRAPTPPGQPAPVPPPRPMPAAPAPPRPAAAPPPRPAVPPTSRPPVHLPPPPPPEGRRSVHIRIPEIRLRVPDLPPIAWVMIAFVVLILFLIIVT